MALLITGRKVISGQSEVLCRDELADRKLATQDQPRRASHCNRHDPVGTGQMASGDGNAHASATSRNTQTKMDMKLMSATEQIDRRSFMPLLGGEAAFLVLAGKAQAQQVLLPKTAAEVPGPAAGTAMTKEYVQTVGRMAYVWGYALVNSHNRRAAFAYVTGQNGNVPGWNGGVLPMAPVGQASMLNDYIKPDQTFVACPNQDVVYGASFSALDKEPTIFQVPDFGDRREIVTQ